MELYALKDVKAGTFGNPMSFVNRAVAIRSLSEAAQMPDNMLSRHGFDYQLYHVGSFDAVSGSLETLHTPDFVITVGDLVPPQKAAA